MQIIRLEAENVLGLKAIKLELKDQNLVVVGGDNAQGKTDAINCFAYALGGKQLCPDEPIREGQDEAHVDLTLDKFIIRRTWKRQRDGTIDTKLEITSADGAAKFSRPQEMLDRLIGPLAFDPAAFARMKPTDQADALRQLVGLDFTALDADHTRAYEQRRDVGRDLKALEARLAAMPRHEVAEAELISTDELVTQLDEIQTHNTGIVQKQAQRRQLSDRVKALSLEAESLAGEIAKLEAMLAKTEEQLAEANESVVAADKWLIEHPLRETDEIRQRITHADEINRKLRENAARTTVKNERDSSQQRYDDFDRKLQGIVNTKARLLAEAKMPIEGLGLGNSGVIYQGRPLEQASAAERLLIALAIGLALAPKKNGLRLLLVRDPAWLDGANLARVRDMAKVNDALIVLERGGTDSECTIIIENGQIKEQKGDEQ